MVQDKVKRQQDLLRKRAADAEVVRKATKAQQEARTAAQKTADFDAIENAAKNCVERGSSRNQAHEAFLVSHPMVRRLICRDNGGV